MEFPSTLTLDLVNRIRIFPTYRILRKTFEPPVELKRIRGTDKIPTLYYAFRNGELASTNLLVPDLLKYKLTKFIPPHRDSNVGNLLVGRFSIGINDCEVHTTDGYIDLPVVYGTDMEHCRILTFDRGHRFDLFGNIGYSDVDKRHLIRVELDLSGIITKYPNTTVSITGGPFEPLINYIENSLIAEFIFDVAIVGEIQLLSFSFSEDLPIENYAIIVDQESTLCDF